MRPRSTNPEVLNQQRIHHGRVLSGALSRSDPFFYRLSHPDREAARIKIKVYPELQLALA